MGTGANGLNSDHHLPSHIQRFMKTETFPWGGSETTYFDGNGAILGYSSSQGTSYSYTDASGATQQSVNLQLFDANHDPIGSVYQDEYGSGSNFRITVSDDASGTVTGVAAVNGVNTQYIQESGTSTHTGPNGESQTREFVYNYAIEPNGSMGNFLGGTETNNGETIVYDANWTITSKSVSASALASLGTALTSAEIAALPTALQDSNGVIASTVTQDWGTVETTYYGALSGSVLGYGEENSWSQPGYGSGSSVNFVDADRNELGSGWTNSDSSGAVIDYGSRFISYGDDTAGGEFSSQTKYKKVEETSYNGDGTVHRTETLYFDNAARCYL